MTMRRVEDATTEEPFLAAGDARVGAWGLRRAVRHHALRLDEEGRRRGRGSAWTELCLLLCDGEETRAAALREKLGGESVEDGENENENSENGKNENENSENGENNGENENGREENENTDNDKTEEKDMEKSGENANNAEEESNPIERNNTQTNREQPVINEPPANTARIEENPKPETENNLESSSLVSQKTATSDLPQRTAENASQTHYDASSVSTDLSDAASARFRSPRPVHGREGVFLRFHPLYRDYFDWVLQDGLDKAMVEEAMRTQGLDPAVDEWTTGDD